MTDKTPLRIATWNVNSIRARETHVRDYLARVSPDILLLQETKCLAEQFPAATFEALGYQAEAVGQKSYNGVAILSRVPFTTRATRLPGLPEDDAQARYIEVHTAGAVLIGIYAPNGNSGGEDGYAYKLNWLDRLADHAEALLDEGTPLAILGDFNICPSGADLAPGALGPDDALARPASRARYRRMIWSGLTDAVRAIHPDGAVYTFWDYQAAAFQRNAGLRIDHALLSATLAERLSGAEPDRAERGLPQPSDHVPVLITLN